MALVQVRVEDSTSIGRSYTENVVKSNHIPGLGARRAALTSRTFDPYNTTTGRSPVLHSIPLAKANMRRATREDVLEYFQNTWDLTDTLFSALKNDSVFYMKPDKLRRALIFYFGHPSALYANKLALVGLCEPINPYFQKLFETGVDEMSWDDMDDMQNDDFAWPDISEVIAFRNATKAMVEKVIREMPNPCDVPVTQESPYWALFMGFEHEKIHVETSSVLIRQLPIDCVIEPIGWRTAPTQAPTPSTVPTNQTVTVAPQTVVLGKTRDFPSFGWDNEYGKRVVNVPKFEASQFLVSNGEFLPFVLEGGYSNKQYWVAVDGDDEGWRWRNFRNATHPSFWVATSHPDMLKYHGGSTTNPYQKDDGHVRAGNDPNFKLRTEFDIIPMPWDWPVEVNYLEAAAFLRWKAQKDGESYRFPTEAEFHALRGFPNIYPEATVGKADKNNNTTPRYVGDYLENTTLDGQSSSTPIIPQSLGSAPESAYDIILQDIPRGNLNWNWHSPTPVNYYPANQNGFYDVHGNVWQWMEDHFAPLPGFQIHYMYDDFSSPCFDGWHTIILGGSWVSSGNLASTYARYHFRRHFFQQLGFRYVKLSKEQSAIETYPGSQTVTNLWEGMSTVSEDITNSFAPPNKKFSYTNDPAFRLDASLQYNAELARYISDTYYTESITKSTDATGGTNSKSTPKVLHIGSGVGGLTFELCRYFPTVIGTDPREPMIRHARIFQHHGQFEYEKVQEGILTETLLVKIPSEIDRSRAAFVFGDVSEAAIRREVSTLGPFDIIVIDNVLTKTRQPLDVLNSAAAVLARNGMIVVASGNDWNPQLTPRNSWLGGFKMNGEDMSTLGMLKYLMKKQNRTLVESRDLPKLTRHHERKYSVEIMEISVFQ